MPSRERVTQFIALVEKGAFVDAIERFYTDDATMQENLAPPRIGRAALVDNERKVVARFKEIKAKCAGPVFIDGDHVIINWIFSFTTADHRTFTLDELAHQRWQGDRIVVERFYYDPGQTRG